MQLVQGGAQLAGAALTTLPTGSSSRSMSTITQIQLGCVSECFGSTSSHPATAAVSQQILAELSTLLTPPATASPVPVPAVEQSVSTQTSCQQQNEQPPAVAQSQSAAQISTTIQLANTAALPAAIESTLTASQPVVQAANQVLQSTWQLQIGCLFDCVGSEQLQQSQQTNTTVDVVTEPAGGSGGEVVDVVTQVIWQVQVGCLSWCYDITQAQAATSDSTVIVLSAAAPTTPPPVSASSSPTNAPTPVAGSTQTGSPPPSTPGGGAPGAPPRSILPPTAPPSSAPPARVIDLRGPAVVGQALLTLRVTLGVAGVRWALSPASLSGVDRSPGGWRPKGASPSTFAAARHAPRQRDRRAPAPAFKPRARHPVAVVEARASEPDTGGWTSPAALTLVLLASCVALAIHRARAGAELER